MNYTLTIKQIRLKHISEFKIGDVLLVGAYKILVGTSVMVYKKNPRYKELETWSFTSTHPSYLVDFLAPREPTYEEIASNKHTIPEAFRVGGGIAKGRGTSWRHRMNTIFAQRGQLHTTLEFRAQTFVCKKCHRGFVPKLGHTGKWKNHCRSCYLTRD